MHEVETRSGIERIAAGGKVLCDAELPLRAIYYPLGFPVEVVTNSHEVLVAAEESWGCFKKNFSVFPLEFHINVTDDGTQECPQEPAYWGQRHLGSIIADTQNFITCDLKEGFAFGWLTRAAVLHRSYFRYFFLEAAALTLISSLHATPIHSACVEMADHGVLLCGDSGAGKTSLAYACARAGWKYLSDDATYLVHGEDRLVIGNSHQFRFRDSAVHLFPELQGKEPTPRATGKPSIEVPTARMPKILTADRCVIDYIIFLNRSEPEPAGFSLFPRDQATQWFEESLSIAGEYREAQLAAIHKLLSVDILELRYRDLDSAVDSLEKLVMRNTWKYQ
jgi:hypothetical protein